MVAKNAILVTGGRHFLIQMAQTQQPAPKTAPTPEAKLHPSTQAHMPPTKHTQARGGLKLKVRNVRAVTACSFGPSRTESMSKDVIN